MQYYVYINLINVIKQFITMITAVGKYLYVNNIQIREKNRISNLLLHVQSKLPKPAADLFCKYRYSVQIGAVDKARIPPL